MDHTPLKQRRNASKGYTPTSKSTALGTPKGKCGVCKGDYQIVQGGTLRVDHVDGCLCPGSESKSIFA